MQGKKLWNARLPYRNRYTVSLGILLLIAAAVLMARFYAVGAAFW